MPRALVAWESETGQVNVQSTNEGRPQLGAWSFAVAWVFLVAAGWYIGARDATARQLLALTCIAYLACWATIPRDKKAASQPEADAKV